MSTSCEMTFSITVGGSTVTPDISTGAVSYFGMDYPAGTYRISYVNGALKYNPSQGWALNAQAINPGSHYAYIYSGGTPEFPGSSNPSFPSQAAVEAANAGVGVTFSHSGGPIGVRLADDIYSDNVSGSPNPTFSLTQLG